VADNSGRSLLQIIKSAINQSLIMNNISPLAYVHPDAVLGDNISIDAFAYIDRNVEIGDGCVIGPHVSIMSGARVGKNNKFFDGAVVSASPQDFRWKGEDSFTMIGDNNNIREHVIINRSIHAGGKTCVGSDSFIMAQTHIGHDTEVGSCVVIGNSVKIAGQCRIGDFCILSSCSLVHEKMHIGEWVLIKGGCRVNNNVPPFVVMAHNPMEYGGVNAFILRKGKFSDELINDIARCYRHIYQSNTSPFNAMIRIRADVAPHSVRDAILEFVEGHDYKIAAMNSEDTHED